MYPSPHKEDRRKNVVTPFFGDDDGSKLRKPSFVQAFLDDDIHTMSRNKREKHNYYHHQSSSTTKKNDYTYDQDMVDKETRGGGGYQFSKSFHDLSFANNVQQPHVFRSNLEDNRSGTISVDNNLDIILPPKDYLGYRANERSDGYRTLGAPNTSRRRMEEKSYHHNTLKNNKSDAIHKKRSQSFLVQSGNISSDILSDENYTQNVAVVPPTNDIDIQHVRSRAKQNGARRSRKLYGDDPSEKYAQDFHKNKRHTYHFPDVEPPQQYNHCEDLTFTKHLSRENVSNGNLNRSSTENLLDDNIGHFVDKQCYTENRTHGGRNDKNKNNFGNSSYFEEVRKMHQRSSSSPPAHDAYGMSLGGVKQRQGHGASRNPKMKEQRGKGNHVSDTDPQVLYSTIDHTKANDNIKLNNGKKNLSLSTHNVRNETFVNRDVNQNNFSNSPDVANECSFLHIEREIPMQSASLEAQKFKTIIFLSGQ